MRKLILTCDSCGQRMQVPRSAIGRTGMCPSCGTTIKIRANNTVTSGDDPRNRGFNARGNWWRGTGTQPTEDAKRRFGEAVDLYYGGRYAEALAIFDGLAQQFPGNPDIESGRMQCMNALKRPQRTFALEDHSGGGGGFTGQLDEETIRRLVLDKMLRSPSEVVQLQAAELAARMLGIVDRAKETESAEGEDTAGGESAPDTASGDYEELPVENEYTVDESEEEVPATHDEIQAAKAEIEDIDDEREARRRTGSTGFFEL